MQLDGGQTEMLCDIRILDGEYFVDVLSLDPFRRDGAAGYGRATAKCLNKTQRTFGRSI